MAASCTDLPVARRRRRRKAAGAFDYSKVLGDHAGGAGLPPPRRGRLPAGADGAACASPRRALLGGAAAITPRLPALAQGKGPDGWPHGRSVSLVIPFTPGGGTDVVARILQDGFAENFGGNFVMEHKPGATTTVGARHVARARPDGMTLLVGSNSALSQAPYAYRNLGYDPMADFTHISLLFASAYLLVAHPRWASFQQVIEAAKREPGKLSYGTWGVGSTAHLLMLEMAEQTGTEMLHVPFGGPAPALTEILAGRLDMMFTTFAPARAPCAGGAAARARRAA